MCIIILILIIVVCTITFFVCSSLLSRPFSSNSTRIVRLLSKIFLSRRRFNETLMFWWLAALPDLHRLIDTTGDHVRMAFVKIYENMIVLAICRILNVWKVSRIFREYQYLKHRRKQFLNLKMSSTAELNCLYSSDIDCINLLLNFYKFNPL